MAIATTSNPSDFANRTQTLYNPKILKALQFNLKLAGYGLSQGYKTIGDTIRFFRPRKANASGINAQALTGLDITPSATPTVLSEGVKPTNLTEVAVGHVDIKMTQRAAYAELTDRLQAIDLLGTLDVYSKTMGEDAALDYDNVIRNWLIDGLYNSDATYNSGLDGGFFERFAGVTNSGDSSTDFASLSGLSKPNAKMTRTEALKMVTQLKTANIPKIGGKYVAVVPPQVIHDMRLDTTWVAAATNSDPEKLYKDLALMVDGVAYVEATNPWVEGATYGTESTTDPGDGLIYSTIYLGADAFGIPNLTNKTAGGTQQAPKLIILNTPDKADPLNQKTCLGWKSFFGAAPFITSVSGERPRYGILRTKTTYK